MRGFAFGLDDHQHPKRHQIPKYTQGHSDTPGISGRYDRRINAESASQAVWRRRGAQGSTHRRYQGQTVAESSSSAPKRRPGLTTGSRQRSEATTTAPMSAASSSLARKRG